MEKSAQSQIALATQGSGVENAEAQFAMHMQLLAQIAEPHSAMPNSQK